MAHARIVIDLGFGDAGKGSTVDYFAREHKSNLVIRFNGGAQAAHNVVVGDLHHTFRQFGSGTLRGAKTLYSRRALFDPIMLLDEARQLETKGVTGAMNLFAIEEDCAITTIFQQAMNRVREISRKDSRHGSCGLGIGETANDKEKYPDLVLFVKDLSNEKLTYTKLEALRTSKLNEALHVSEGCHSAKLQEELDILGNSEYSRLATDAYQNIIKYVRVVSHEEAIVILRGASSPIFEGAQGILLDQEYGFYPYITRSDVTPTNAIAMCKEAGIAHEVTGLLRAYTVRHGPGPMPTEDVGLTETLRDYHNAYGEWQQGFRVGYFDVVLAQYAVDVCPQLDNIMITCTDRLAEMTQVNVAVSHKSIQDPEPISFFAMSKDGKAKMELRSRRLMLRDAAYDEFVSPLASSSMEYQFAYARHVLSLINRNVRLLGISSGTRSSDKHLA